MSSIDLPASLSAVVVPDVPRTAYYVSNFLSKEEESDILETFSSRPQSAFRNLSHRRLQVYPSALTPNNVLHSGRLPLWIKHPILPRLLSIPIGSPVGTGKELEALGPLANVFTSSPHREPNHALLNEYRPGTGIFPHEDGPAYYPIVATVSLGSQTVLDIYPKPPKSSPLPAVPSWRILQEPQSLLVTTGPLYQDTLHGIAGVEVDEALGPCKGEGRGIVNWDMLRPGTREMIEANEGTLARGTRVSVTLRDVNVVKDLGKLLPGLGR